MEKIKRKVLYSAFGVTGGLAGTIPAISSCAGGACASCFGCAGAGLGLVALALFSKLKKSRSKEDIDAVA